MNLEVGFLTKKIRQDFINDDDLLSSTYPPSSEHLLNDLNDYVPFMQFFGHHDFVEQQIEAAKSKVVNGLIPINNRIISWRQDEWLEALFEHFKSSNSE